jgi:hypothetical protein
MTSAVLPFEPLLARRPSLASLSRLIEPARIIQHSQAKFSERVINRDVPSRRTYSPSSAHLPTFCTDSVDCTAIPSSSQPRFSVDLATNFDNLSYQQAASCTMATWGNFPPAPGTQTVYGMPPSMSSHPTSMSSITLSTNTVSDMAAYTPVQTRQTFAYPQVVPMMQQQPYPPQQFQPQMPHQMPSQVAAAPVTRAKIQWPTSVRSWVSKAFAETSGFPEITRSEIETKLKETISQATDDGSLWNIDWETQPLPQQMIRNERAAWSASTPTYVAPVVHQSPPTKIPKKRKSQERDEDSASPPPWRSTNTRNGFEDRITQPTNLQAPNTPAASKNTSKFQKAQEKRQKKFDGGYKSTYQRSPTPEPSSGPVVGTSTQLEKKYFRLTAPPIPSQVRPLPILKQTLELLKKKWRKDSNYSYICDQFKSMRQDLTVQRIKDKFTVEVYEIHARIALEKGDLGEYNQCQTQLRVMYGEIEGGNPTEFAAYRILYFIHTSNRTSLNDALADLTPTEKKDPAVKHALDVRSALAVGNYHRFFRLYLDTPNMGAYLMDMFVVRERLSALSKICKV